MNAPQVMTSVSAVAVLDDDETQDVDLTCYAVDGHVVLATAHPSEEDGVMELDPVLVMMPRCAETFARDILARCAEARGAARREAGDA